MENNCDINNLAKAFPKLCRKWSSLQNSLLAVGSYKIESKVTVSHAKHNGNIIISGSTCILEDGM